MLNFLNRKPQIEVGTLVDANFNGKGKWLRGKIVKGRSQNTYDIQFENGKSENGVAVKNIRVIDDAISTPIAASNSPDKEVSVSSVVEPDLHNNHVIDSAPSSRAPSVAGDDHSVTSVTSNNSKNRRTSISKFFHFGASNTPPAQDVPVSVTSRSDISASTQDTSGIAFQAKSAISEAQSKLLPPTNQTPPILPINPVTKAVRKKKNTTSLNERIKRLHASDSKSIDISELDLTSLPVMELKSCCDGISIMNASRNELSNIVNVYMFSNIVQLDLSHNRLSTLQTSGGIGWTALTSLKLLDVSRNLLTELSTEILSLGHLETLIVHHNQLTALPAPGRMSGLRALRRLDVSYNRLESLGDELECLTRLDDLNITHNVDVNGSETDVDRLGDRARDLHEKKLLFSSKSSRRALVSRAIDVQKRVVIREQERIIKEYTDSHNSSRGAQKPHEEALITEQSPAVVNDDTFIME